MRKSPTAFGTLKPEATVAAFSNSSAKRFPSSNARMMGAHPSDWTETMRGLLPPIQPIASISSNAFHMPTSPVPPPVG
jgi:hypothetical protein